jgi:hypothetical protein
MKNVMNENNLEYLNRQVFFSGFGEGLENELKANIEKEVPKFQLTHEDEFGKDKAMATLEFRKSENSDMYFFNKYFMSVIPENGKEPVHQTFYVGRENNITFKEAYNLMSGRAILKEWTKMERVGEGDQARFQGTDEKYKAWKQLNFKESDAQGNFKQEMYHGKYGFDLEKALDKLPIKELQNETAKERLMDSLHRGNLQSVTFLAEDKELKRFIEANPKDRMLNVYDDKMQRLIIQQGNEEKLNQGADKILKKDEDQSQKEGKERRARQKVA